MQWLLIFFYCALVCFCISRLKFFKNSGIKIQWWCAAFLMKVAVGILYGYIHSQSSAGGDTWCFFRQGMRIHSFIARFGVSDYLKMVFLPCREPIYHGLERWSNDFHYGDESNYLLVRFHALAALISFGYYNVHVVFYNLISFAGVALLYSSFRKELGEKAGWVLIALCCIPGIAFWTSGMHKDGMALLGIALLFFSVMNPRKSFFLNSLIALGGIALLLIVRPYIVFLFIPFMAVYYFFGKEKKHLLWYYLTSAVLFFVFLLSLNSIIPGFSLLERIVWWQQEFCKLVSTSNTLYIPPLHANIVSFLSVLPYAFDHSLLRPYFWDSKNVFQIISSVHDLLLLIIFIVVVIYSIRKKNKPSHLFYLSKGYVITLYGLLGLIVPNLGALVRYKSTGTFFFALAIICLLPKDFYKKIFRRN